MTDTKATGTPSSEAASAVSESKTASGGESSRRLSCTACSRRASFSAAWIRAVSAAGSTSAERAGSERLIGTGPDGRPGKGLGTAPTVYET